MTPAQLFVLLVSLLGALAGAIAFLFHTLVESKDGRIAELVLERDYWRTLVGIEAHLANPGDTPSLPGSSEPRTVIIRQERHDDGGSDDRGSDRFGYYSLAIQAVISIVTLLLCFWLIATPTEPAVNSAAFNIVVFIIGVWLGRGVDYGVARIRK
jgi:hypothetical protein